MSTAKNNKKKEESTANASEVKPIWESKAKVINSIDYNGEELPFSVSTKAVFAMEIELEKTLEEIIQNYNMKHAIVAIRECIKAGFKNRNLHDKAQTITDEFVLDLIDSVPETYTNTYLTLDKGWQKFNAIQKVGN
jgi:hypothetical protein